MRALALMVVAVAFALPTEGAAQSQGLYLSGAIGTVLTPDTEFTGTGFSNEASLDPGLSGALALGTTFGQNWRGEISLSHRFSDVDAVSGAANGSGEISGSAAMVNGYYDLFSGSDWRPYIGGGVGIMRLNVDSVSPIGGSTIDDEDTVVAIQGIAGLGYRVNARLGLFTDYRFLTTTEPGFATAAGTRADAEYSEHHIMIGLRWSFGGAEPAAETATTTFMEPKNTAKKPLDMPWSPPERKQTAPPPKQPLAPASKPAVPAKPAPAEQLARASEPAKAPAAGQRFLVYFGWDRSTLTGEARSIIRAAGEAGAGGRATGIHATGHADRSGSVRYNMTLSQRRAEAVKAELMKLGVPADAISLEWKGETAPVAKTADGIREPKNRRVEILLR